MHRLPRWTLLALSCLILAPAWAQDTVQLQVERLFTHEFRARWMAADAEGLAALWTDDGEWSNVIGSRRLFRGRDAVRGVWEVGLDGRETADQLALEVIVDRVTLLAPDLAVADLVMAFGSDDRQMREAMVAVLKNGAEGWRIRSAFVARVPGR